MHMFLRLPCPLMPALARSRDSGRVLPVRSWVRSCWNVGCVGAGTARGVHFGAHTVLTSTPSAVNAMLKDFTYTVRASAGGVPGVSRCLCISSRFAVDWATPSAAVFCCKQPLQQILHVVVVFSGSNRFTVLAGKIIIGRSEFLTCDSTVCTCTAS